MELDGRTAVVTGAASGIGLALTERFLTEGMSVVMADIEQPALEREASRIVGAGGRVTPVVCDVSDSHQVNGLRDAALAAYGSVQLLCNNAGVAAGTPNYKTKPGIWDWVVGVNVLGPAYGVSAFVPLMLDQGEGHVVNTASEAGLTSSPVLGSYHASKYAVVGLSESLALELEGTPVGVSCLCPELVDTRIFEATRNAPAALALERPPAVAIDEIAQFMGTVAKPPADLAAEVVYAIRAGQFWILTHESTRARVHARNSRLEQGRNPKFGSGA
ncbi:MAG: SDR family NAD(P)-dependent oxidoreductase [Acidimicrobiales bacterium]|jgi:NAD(P)-dependent dehydrogenase (short-subunit alcohol dehydrogenase family)